MFFLFTPFGSALLALVGHQYELVLVPMFLNRSEHTPSGLWQFESRISGNRWLEGCRGLCLWSGADDGVDDGVLCGPRASPLRGEEMIRGVGPVPLRDWGIGTVLDWEKLEGEMQGGVPRGHSYSLVYCTFLGCFHLHMLSGVIYCHA
jgi:hypothetical protein